MQVGLAQICSKFAICFTLLRENSIILKSSCRFIFAQWGAKNIYPFILVLTIFGHKPEQHSVTHASRLTTITGGRK